MSENQRNQVKNAGFAGQVLSTGLTGGICLAISLFLGYQIDLYCNTRPAGILGGIVLGIASAAVQTWKQLRESLNAFEQADRDRKNKAE